MGSSMDFTERTRVQFSGSCVITLDVFDGLNTSRVSKIQDFCISCLLIEVSLLTPDTFDPHQTSTHSTDNADSLWQSKTL